MNAPTTTTTKLPTTIYYDSANGYEAIAVAVQELAKAYGWENEPEDVESEWFSEAEAEATCYLEVLAPEGHWAGWYEGTWAVWPIRYQANQFRYIINLDERGEFSASFYRIDEETGQDSPKSYQEITTEDTETLSEEGINCRDGEAVMQYYNDLTGDRTRFSILEDGDEPEEDRD